MGVFGIGRSSVCKFYLQFNEGGAFFNFTVLWYRKPSPIPGHGKYFYIYFCGKRWSKWLT